MGGIPAHLARLTLPLQTQGMLRNLQSTQAGLFKYQEQISTGLRVNRPSDDATVAGSISSLRTVLELFEQRSKNLAHAEATIDNTDAALSDINDLLIEAHSIASSQIGIGSDTSTRQSMAQLIDGFLDSLSQIVSREYLDVHLFGGQSTNVSPFEADLGGYRYRGPEANLETDLGFTLPLGVNTNGAEALGALSGRIEATGPSGAP